ncbi:MAG: hypothetical protein DWB99_03035 [Candidatus Poseidoniales archaeon]|uniref:Uncharacterized protein n=1 Tax=uncultured archaeon MedDCM-OCT-S04-C163 TaxID=743086 RepID=D6PB86_9ARCH|nr:hypothetical protein [uncultured archaeon MedDCM-OCT-S04-C163]RJU83126.1 MAG: hypothetical protein DWB99_03035 [Candidatus Poseidoniales archaeon]
MEFAQYSLALIISFALVRFITENTKFHLRAKGLWVHHWILAAVAMSIVYLMEIGDPIIWGCLTGVALEGLRRKNWSIRDSKKK